MAIPLPPNVRSVGVPWFTAETWPRLLEVSGADADNLPDTYEEWLAVAEPRFAQHVANGMPLVRVLIDPDELLAWCEDNGLPVNQEARATFAALVLARRARAH